MALGNYGFLLLLSFLLFSAVVDKIKKKALRREEDISEKTSKRDEIQVLANGIVAMFMAMFFMIDTNRIFILAFVCALAEAFADTCGSGFGAFSKSTRNIIGLKPIKSGLSGGVTWIGTLASLLASFGFSAIALALGMLDILELLIVSAFAFVGSIFDSVLGALIQAKFKCEKCGELTEKRTHCDMPTVKCSGVSFITNDAVNLFSTLFSALITILYFVLI